MVDGFRWGLQEKNRKIGYTLIGKTKGKFHSYRSWGWDDKELVAWAEAIDSIQSVCDIEFVNRGENNAENVELWLYSVRNNSDELGFAFTPGSDDDEGLVAVGWRAYKNRNGKFTSSIAPGSYHWITYIHELGHAIGLKHPHDRGMRGEDRFPGLRQNSDQLRDAGSFGQNAQPYTMMTYVDKKAKNGLVSSSELAYGFLKTPGALDIATLQHMYGINRNTATGDDVYVLPTFNEEGVGWVSIWDAGGWDRLDGSKSNEKITLDLRNATLDLGLHAGGYVSQVEGVYGGFTIAHDWDGVSLGDEAGLCVIEEAEGGSAADVLIGNHVANRLIGGPGADRLTGGLGGDEFVIDMTGAYGRKHADRITDFDSGDGDKLCLSSAGSWLSDGTKISRALSKKHGKSLALSDSELIYNQRNGFLYLNQNGEAVGYGEGGLFAILRGAPDLSVGDIFLN
ncbi:MAG TPA: M10 family metallopeptidase [Prochlorococcaceae cyanobacterium Fu_MAG_50]|nr:M10 family metallopeptidase [Prochlorococcaceae cyanobacterium Fu_MAG_50]